MNKFALKDFTRGIERILRNPQIKTITVFCYSPITNCKSPQSIKQRVRITRRGRPHWNELIVNFGKLNYGEKNFLKQCEKGRGMGKLLGKHPAFQIKFYKEKKK